MTLGVYCTSAHPEGLLSSHESVCLHAYPSVVAWQRLLINAITIRSNWIVECVDFYAILVITTEIKLIVLARISCWKWGKYVENGSGIGTDHRRGRARFGRGGGGQQNLPLRLNSQLLWVPSFGKLCGLRADVSQLHVERISDDSKEFGLNAVPVCAAVTVSLSWEDTGQLWLSHVYHFPQDPKRSALSPQQCVRSLPVYQSASWQFFRCGTSWNDGIRPHSSLLSSSSYVMACVFFRPEARLLETVISDRSDANLLTNHLQFFVCGKRTRRNSFSSLLFGTERRKLLVSYTRSMGRCKLLTSPTQGLWGGANC
jgi:hypothetical protein